MTKYDGVGNSLHLYLKKVNLKELKSIHESIQQLEKLDVILNRWWRQYVLHLSKSNKNKDSKENTESNLPPENIDLTVTKFNQTYINYESKLQEER